MAVCWIRRRGRTRSPHLHPYPNRKTQQYRPPSLPRFPPNPHANLAQQTPPRTRTLELEGKRRRQGVMTVVLGGWVPDRAAMVYICTVVFSCVQQ